MLQQKIEVIISKSKIIFEAIQNNLLSQDAINTFSFNEDYSLHISSFAKIDLLIIDDYISSEIFLGHVKTIINLTNLNYLDNNFLLKKPFKLAELLEIIKINRDRKQIFCRLNYSWLYDEEAGKLYNQTSIIRFTERENKVFKCLLTTEDNKISKGNLYKKVWQYHSESSSSTIETHMSRLKHKLPQDFMQLKSNYYKLIVTDIG